VIKLILIGPGVIVLGIAISLIIGRVRETVIVNRMEAMLLDQHCSPYVEVVDFNSFSDLPPPVTRYFKHVLVDDQYLIGIARMHQSGMLRTNMNDDTWSSFTAHQIVVPPAVGFIWNAKVGMPLGTHVRVLDSYCAGEGAGRVTILSAFAVASDAGNPELNSGALHRYLSEAVWYPTALLPQSGVVWNPIDDRSATAILTDNGITVSLEFRFNDADEVVAIYSSGRFGRFDGEYKQVPWEGHFRDYQIRQGMRIPMYGEVGWYEDDTLNLVWKGNLLDVQYQLGH
jgi:hypothetical protein